MEYCLGTEIYYMEAFLCMERMGKLVGEDEERVRHWGKSGGESEKRYRRPTGIHRPGILPADLRDTCLRGSLLGNLGDRGCDLEPVSDRPAGPKGHGSGEAGTDSHDGVWH